MRHAAAPRPAQRQLHRLPRLVLGRRVRGTFVEDHHDIGTQLALYLHGLLRPEEHLVPVDRRAEGHALLGNLAQGTQAEYLEAAGIGQDRAVPVHEIVQRAVLADDSGAGPQHQVKGVAENDFGAGGAQFLGRHRLDRAIGAHRHERRCLYRASRKLECPAPRRAVTVGPGEVHGAPASAATSSRADMNMASP